MSKTAKKPKNSSPHQGTAGQRGKPMQMTEAALLHAGYIEFYDEIIFDGRGGLSNSLREAMFYHYAGKTAFVLDALLFLGVGLGTQGYTFKELYNRLEWLGIRENTARQGLRPFISKKRQKTGGRPAYTYDLPTFTQLASQFGCDISKPEALVTDPLRAGDMATMADYRRGLYREHLSRYTLKNAGQGVKLPRGLLSQRLGLSRTGTRHYDAAVGVDVRQTVEVVDTCESRLYVPLILAKYPRAKGYYVNLVDQNAGRVIAAPMSAVVLFAALKRGFRVEIVRQSYNVYTLPPTGAYCPTSDGWGYSIWRSSPLEILHNAISVVN